MRPLICLLLFATSAANAGTLTPIASFGPNPGGLKAYEYVPAGLPAGRPLVVALHGCTQTAQAMQAAGWDALADAHQFAVLYPEQQTANNPVRCFNWAGEYGDTANLVRGQGENASIMSMVDDAIARHAIDRDRVYVVGLSAGGAMTAVMLATWPDRFAAGAVMSGVAYRCATSLNEALSCQNPGVTKAPAAWGDLVRSASGGFSGPWPRMQVWQGSSDTTVAPVNADELVKQWTNVHGTDATADATETLGAATHTAFTANGKVVVEAYKIDGMGHGVVIGGAGCPSTAGAFFLDKGVCSTTIAAEFFGLVGGGSGGGDGGGSGGGGGGGSAGTKSGGCSAGLGAGWLVGLAGLGMGLRRRSRRGRAHA